MSTFLRDTDPKSVFLTRLIFEEADNSLFGTVTGVHLADVDGKPEVMVTITFDTDTLPNIPLHTILRHASLNIKTITVD